VPGDVIEALRKRGHNVTVTDVGGVKAVVNAVVRGEDGVIYGASAGGAPAAIPVLMRAYAAASDSRKNGIAAGW
jgi:gamma-glutamyltranspeptidase/glutathione hydrolase/leukotriene-C4 hydrolase